MPPQTNQVAASLILPPGRAPIGAEMVACAMCVPPERTVRAPVTGGNAITDAAWQESQTRFRRLFRRAKQRNRFPFVATVDAKIGLVDRQDNVPGIELAHANEAESGQVRMAVGISDRQFVKLFLMARAIERNSN